MKNKLLNIVTLGCLCGLVCFPFPFFAQLDPIPTGTWRSHFNYDKGQSLAVASGKIYYAAQAGLFSYHIQTQETDLLGTSDGFAEVVVSKMAYHSTTNKLIVAYSSGNIDLVKLDASGEIVSAVNIPNIKINQTIISSKSCNEIYFQDNTAYLSTNYGIVSVDLAKDELRQVWRNIGLDGATVPIYSTRIIENKIYALSERWLLRATIGQNNLANYQNWEPLPLPSSNLVQNKGLLYLDENLNILLPYVGWYQLKNDVFLSKNSLNVQINSYTTVAANVVLACSDGLYQLDKSSYKLVRLPLQGLSNVADIVQNQNKIYVADTEAGLNEIAANQTRKLSPKLSEAIKQTRDDEVVTDNIGNTWSKLPPGQGLSVMGKNGQKKEFSSIPLNDNDNTISSQVVKSIRLEKTGLVMLGTDRGIVALNPDDRVSSTNSLFGYIITPRINNGRVLQNEIVNAIAIDGGNRKWVGTNNGLYLYNADITALLAKFTVENSPLPTNTVDFLSIDGKMGEVYIYTPLGIVSYRADATEAADIQGSSLEIFPNPIRPGFNGVLTINGLVANAFVKITDVAGRLLYQTQANGGTAIWNLQTANNTALQTGVYYIFSANSFGKETIVGKFAVVR